MIYQIVSPIVQTINGDSLKDAIKNFVKINDMYSLNKLIVTDQQNAGTTKWCTADGSISFANVEISS